MNESRMNIVLLKLTDLNLVCWSEALKFIGVNDPGGSRPSDFRIRVVGVSMKYYNHLMYRNMRWKHFPKWWLFTNRKICVY